MTSANALTATWLVNCRSESARATAYGHARTPTKRQANMIVRQQAASAS